MSDRPITVIIPVFGRADEVRDCVQSVLRHAAGGVDSDLLLIDDASPGGEVGDVLAEIERSSTSVRVETNEHNLGFAATVNRGLHATSGDVVVLNSDTVVTAGWLDRLADAATPDDVATVTPLTNEGSICSLAPDLVDGLDLHAAHPPIDDVATFVAAYSLRSRPEIIAGVGFCLYITRRAIDLVGDLDADRFGRGYGEEVDFCLRASAAGLRHVVEDSTFVFHVGGASFGDESAEAKARGSAVLHARHPTFRAANRAERRRDPLGPTMAALRLGLHPRDTSRPYVLHVLHTPSRYGGTEKHLDALIDGLSNRFDSAVFTPSPHGFVLRTRWGDGTTWREHEFLLGGCSAALDDVVDPLAGEVFAAALDLDEFDAVHVHNLIGHSLAPLDALRGYAGRVICTVHDYYLACPHHWLLYRNQVPCGIPDDLSLCSTCLPETRGLPVEVLVDFRQAVRDRLDVVDEWVFPSTSAADQLQSLYDIDDDRINVIPHGSVTDIEPGRRVVDEAHVLHAPLRIAFVGRGWAKKGLDVANWLAEGVHDRPIEVHHFGEAKEQASEHLVEHGAYDNRELPALLRAHGIHVVWLPGPYAETFGLVMTESLAAGLPVLGPTYGAIGERIREQQVGWTVDTTDLDGIRTLVEGLDTARVELLRATRRAAAVPLPTVAETTPAYAALYRSLPG